jgi:hypothetical protein
MIIIRAAIAAALATGALAAPLAVAEGQQWPAVHGRGICNTPYGWCPLPNPELIPAGSPCYCIASGQVVMGCTENREFFGNISPYFNFHTRQIDVPSVPSASNPKCPRVSLLVPGMPSARGGLDAVRQGLRELGYIEGQNIALELRWDKHRPEQTPGLAAELARVKVDTPHAAHPPPATTRAAQ